MSNERPTEVNKEKIISFLRENRNLLEQKFGIKKIALFGSYARNEATPESDLDFLIEVENPTFRNRLRLRDFLEKHFGKKVEIGYFDSIRNFIKEEIQEDLIYA